MTNTHTNMPETAQNLNVEPSSARVASQDLHQSMSTPDSLSSGEVVNNDARTIAHSEKFNPETNIKETVPDSSPLNSDGNSEPVEKMLCLATSGTIPIHTTPIPGSSKDLRNNPEVPAPINLITSNITRITPDMLPLIDLTQQDIDIIIKQVDGGVANIQDIYSLSPVQDGMLFHHIMTAKGDPYMTIARLYFDNRDILDRYLDAYQRVQERHDTMRTIFLWEGLSTPAQVVLRSAALPVTELSLDPVNGPIAEQMTEILHPRSYRLDITRAPLYQYVIAQDTDGRWIADECIHHIACDQATVEIIRTETKAFLRGMGDTLPQPQPLRNLIAQVRSGPSTQDHQRFFTKMLAGVDSPALPFGMTTTKYHAFDTNESRSILSKDLNRRLRGHAKKMDVSAARMCHLAWAQVMARISGQERVVFGTIVSSRGRAGSADHVMGPFINTLPIRVDVGGISVVDSLYRVKDDISALLGHEHAALALAQRCRSVHDPNPLFCSVFNFRKGDPPTSNAMDNGIEILERREMITYPFAMSVEYRGDTLSLKAQVMEPFDSSRICGYMNQALESLADALDNTPNMPVWELEVIPKGEREMLLNSWNNTATAYPDLTIHRMFEQHANQLPDAIAIVYEGQALSYRELNEHANRLAHHLIKLGVKPDSLVAICVDRSPTMIVALMAVLKAGGAYVPMDPSFASERLHNILADVSPSILLADNSGKAALSSSLLQSIIVVDPNVLFDEVVHNPRVYGLTPHNLAYVIYTSGSTGNPKGVMIEHQSVANLAMTRPSVFGVGPSSRVLQFFSVSFDGSVHEIVSALCIGGSLHILPDSTRMDRSKLWSYLREHSITHATLTPSFIQDCTDMPRLDTPLTIILAGEALSSVVLKELRRLIPNGTIINDYGPTETSVDAVGWRCPNEFNGEVAPIGRPHANKRVYVLDTNRRPVPMGAVGELYISGIGVARGYLNRPEWTEKTFLPDSFTTTHEFKMYKTGDLVRYLPSGNLVFLGRRDHQVKIRGFRIELGEIEARLAEHSLVKESAVIARGEGNNKRLVAYVVAERDDGLPRTLRSHLTAKLPDYMVPSAFVQLNAFPLTPNGKLDTRALPDPDSNAFVSQGYEAPQGDAENALAKIWAKLLKVDRVGRHDNFFMLGGHSLLAVKMSKEVHSVLGQEINVRALFDAPTIAELVSYLQKNEVKKDPSFNVLFPLKPQGNRLPLFCIHPAGGLSWSYVRLAKHFHLEQPIYGLQSRGIDGTENHATSMDELASDYIEQIQSIQPRGPYHLLGWSFGGNVAQNIAVQLKKRNEQVALLALMDPTLDYGQIAADIEADIERVFFAEYAAMAGDKGSMEEGKVLWEKVQRMIRINLNIAKQHSTSVFPGDMIYFSATKTTPYIEPSSWAPFTVGRIEVHDVECKHIEMDQPQWIATVGRVLGKKLEELHKQRRLSKL